LLKCIRRQTDRAQRISGKVRKGATAADHVNCNRAGRGSIPYHLYEAASPGWWERTNRRLAKEQGRVMTGYTPGGKIPYTPMGLGAPTMTVPAAH
jgi:hypothetical protein